MALESKRQRENLERGEQSAGRSGLGPAPGIPAIEFATLPSEIATLICPLGKLPRRRKLQRQKSIKLTNQRVCQFATVLTRIHRADRAVNRLVVGGGAVARNRSTARGVYANMTEGESATHEQIDVVYENGVLRPLGPLAYSLEEHQHLTVTLECANGGRDWLADADPSISLDDVRQALGNIPGTLAQLVDAEREER
jgi:hypothetical protein